MNIIDDYAVYYTMAEQYKAKGKDNMQGAVISTMVTNAMRDDEDVRNALVNMWCAIDAYVGLYHS